MNRCDPIIHYSELAKFPERCHEYCYSRCARRTRLFGCLHIVYAVDPAVVVIETRSVSAATAHDVSVCYRWNVSRVCDCRVFCVIVPDRYVPGYSTGYGGNVVVVYSVDSLYFNYVS